MNKKIQLYRNITYDIKAGVGRNYLYYFFWALIILLLTIVIISEQHEINEKYVLSIYDVMARFFLGVPSRSYDVFQTVQIPFEWIMWNVYIIYGVARYPKLDYEECGHNVRIRVKSRFVWWLSKFIWCLMHIVLMHMIAIFVIAVVLGCMQGDLGVSWNTYNIDVSDTYPLKKYIVLFVMPIICELTTSTIVMLISFMINSLVGLFVGFIMMVMAIFECKSYIVTSYMMLYSYYMGEESERLHLKNGLVLCLLITITAFFLGEFIYSKYEMRKV